MHNIPLADITYVPTGEEWLYLAVVLDLFTHKIVDWAMRDHLRAELPTAALTMAIQRQPRRAHGQVRPSYACRAFSAVTMWPSRGI